MSEHDDEQPPAFPGFGGMARRRRGILADLVAQRRAAGLSQTEVAARMGTSQSAVARLEGGAVDVRLSTLDRYANAVHRRLEMRLGDAADSNATGGNAAGGEPTDPPPPTTGWYR